MFQMVIHVQALSIVKEIEKAKRTSVWANDGFNVGHRIFVIAVWLWRGGSGSGGGATSSVDGVISGAAVKGLQGAPR